VKRTALVSLAVLASCAVNRERETPRPDVVVAEAWRSPAEPGPVADDAWWRSFGEPALAACVDEALANNRDLFASAARLRAAEALAHAAGAERLPSADLSLDAARRKQIFVGLPVPGGSVLESTASSYGVSLDLGWEIDLWGRLAAAARAARRDAAASAADLAAARQSIAAQTAKAWLAVRTARLQLELARRTVTTREQSLATVERRFDGGRATALDVRLARADLAAARALEAARIDGMARLERQLELLLGRPPGPLEGRAAAAAGAELPAVPPAPSAGLPGELVARRPDLAAAEARLLAADARLAEARAALYPSLRLGSQLGTTSDDPGDLVDPDFSVWSIVGGLVQPVFHGGALRDAIEAQDARLAEALAGFESALLRALSEVETALRGEVDLALLEERTGAAHDEARGAADLAEERYASGSAGLLDLLVAERRALEAESELLGVQERRLAQRIDLHLALGGGFAAGTTTPVAPSER